MRSNRLTYVAASNQRPVPVEFDGILYPCQEEQVSVVQYDRGEWVEQVSNSEYVRPIRTIAEFREVTHEQMQSVRVFRIGF